MIEEIILNKDQRYELVNLINLCLSLSKRDLNRDDGFILSTRLSPKRHIKSEIKRLLDIEIEWR